MMPTKQAAVSDIPFEDRDFQAVARIAKTAFGLHLEVSKKALIQSRLTRRLRALGLKDFSTYCRLLSDGNAIEKDHFISALTTNVTHFFREPHHFEYLEKQILPELVRRARSGGRIRIWSAGCSTGQEAFSLAGTMLHVLPEAANYDIRILASDIDPNVLSVAKAGRYRGDECRFPNEAWKSRIFQRRTDQQDSIEKVRKDVMELVTFRRLNLMETWPMPGDFDIIMCRNVAIYFDKTTQSTLWQRFSQKLASEGTLFIGHSERIHGPACKTLTSSGITTYRKSSPRRTLSNAKQEKTKWH